MNDIEIDSTEELRAEKKLLADLNKKSSEIKANMSITLLKRSLIKYLNQ